MNPLTIPRPTRRHASTTRRPWVLDAHAIASMRMLGNWLLERADPIGHTIARRLLRIADAPAGERQRLAAGAFTSDDSYWFEMKVRTRRALEYGLTRSLPLRRYEDGADLMRSLIAAGARFRRPMARRRSPNRR